MVLLYPPNVMSVVFVSLLFVVGVSIAQPIPPKKGLEVLKAPNIPYGGWGNNLVHPALGALGQYFSRMDVANYVDKTSKPQEELRPDPREVSEKLFPREGSYDNGQESSTPVNDLFTAFAEFIHRELADWITKATPIEQWDVNDPGIEADSESCQETCVPYLRNKFDSGTGNGPGLERKMVNDATPFLDGEMVYGKAKSTADSLRTFKDGLMRTRLVDGHEYLPISDYSPAELYGYMYNPAALPAHFVRAAGNQFVNESPGMLVLTTLFIREHNREARDIGAQRPDLQDEEIFQLARRWVVGVIQAIFMNEFLPAIGICIQYEGYDHEIAMDTSTEFATTAMMFYQTMQNEYTFKVPRVTLTRTDTPTPSPSPTDEAEPQFLKTCDTQFFPDLYEADLVAAGSAQVDGVTAMVNGMLSQPARVPGLGMSHDQRVGRVSSDSIGALGLRHNDAVAEIIQRGRDHGLASYERHVLGETGALPEVNDTVRAMYPSPDTVDLFPGGISEDHVPMESQFCSTDASGNRTFPLRQGYALLGPTFKAILVDQFNKVVHGDKFWYQNLKGGLSMSRMMSDRIATFGSLHRLVVRNTNVSEDTLLGRFVEEPSTGNLNLMLLNLMDSSNTNEMLEGQLSSDMAGPTQTCPSDLCENALFREASLHCRMDQHINRDQQFIVFGSALCIVIALGLVAGVVVHSRGKWKWIKSKPEQRRADYTVRKSGRLIGRVSKQAIPPNVVRDLVKESHDRELFLTESDVVYLINVFEWCYQDSTEPTSPMAKVQRRNSADWMSLRITLESLSKVLGYDQRSKSDRVLVSRVGAVFCESEDNQLSLLEFIRFFAVVCGHAQQSAIYDVLFDIFDVDRSGEIIISEFRDTMIELLSEDAPTTNEVPLPSVSDVNHLSQIQRFGTGDSGPSTGSGASLSRTVSSPGPSYTAVRGLAEDPSALGGGHSSMPPLSMRAQRVESNVSSTGSEVHVDIGDVSLETPSFRLSESGNDEPDGTSDSKGTTATSPETASAVTPETASTVTPETETAATPETATATSPQTETATTPDTTEHGTRAVSATSDRSSISPVKSRGTQGSSPERSRGHRTKSGNSDVNRNRTVSQVSSVSPSEDALAIWCESIFENWDDNENASVNREEFVQGLRSCGISPRMILYPRRGSEIASWLEDRAKLNKGDLERRDSFKRDRADNTLCDKIRLFAVVHRDELIIGSVIFILTLLVVVERFLFYFNRAYIRIYLSGGVIVTRCSAQIINLYVSLCLLAMCKVSITLLQRRKGKTRTFARFLLQNRVSIHRWLGYLTAVAAIIHVIGHDFNFATISSMRLGALNLLLGKEFQYSSKTVGEIVVDSNVSGLVFSTGGNVEVPVHRSFARWVYFTGTGGSGYILVVLFGMIIIYSMQFVRKFAFDVFYWVHRICYMIIIPIIIWHGSAGIVQDAHFPYFALFPISLYVAEQIFLVSRGKYKMTVLDATYSESSKVLSLTLKPSERDRYSNGGPGGVPRHFDFLPGMWAQIELDPSLYGCCAFGTHTTPHPFTISSPPQTDDGGESVIMFHIRVVGPFTNMLTDIYAKKRDPRSAKAREKSTASSVMYDPRSSRNGGHPSVQLRPAPHVALPDVSMYGPFGSPLTDGFDDYKVAVCIAGGIGITPFMSLLYDALVRAHVQKEHNMSLRGFALRKIYLIWLSPNKSTFSSFQSFIHEIENMDIDLGTDILEIKLVLSGASEEEDLRRMFNAVVIRTGKQAKKQLEEANSTTTADSTTEESSHMRFKKADFVFGSMTQRHMEKYLKKIVKANPSVDALRVLSCGPSMLVNSVKEIVHVMNRKASIQEQKGKGTQTKLDLVYEKF